MSENNIIADNIMEEIMNQCMDSIKELKDGMIVKGRVVDIAVNDIVIDIGAKSEAFISKDEFINSPVNIGDEVDVLVESLEDDNGNLVLSKRKADKIIGWEKVVAECEPGQIVEGVIMRIVKGGFIVDVYGVDCFLPNSLSALRGREREAIGERHRFQLIKINKLRKNVVLSRKGAIVKEKEEKRKKLWDEIAVDDIREGIVKNITDFGAFVDLGGVDGLLHITDISWSKVSHPSDVLKVGEKVKVKILHIDKETGKLALGMKQTTKDPWEGVSERYQAGTTVKGRVVNIMPYGVFVELEPGLEGLIHVSEISWTKRNINPADVFKPNDEVEVMVLSVDEPSRKLSLGYKQLQDNPWDKIEEKIPVGSVVKGRINGFTEYGAFVGLVDGIEGMIHVSDMSWTRKISHPQEMFKKGDEVEVKILSIDKDAQRIALGYKQTKPNPWPEIVKKYPLESVVQGDVIKITNFGVFLKLEEGIEGLVYMSEIDESMLDKIKLNDKLNVRIVKVDPDQMKIGLSMKDVDNKHLTEGQG